MEHKDTELHRIGCSVSKQTILTTHPSGLQTRVSVELANFDTLCLHQGEMKSSPFFQRRGLISGSNTPILSRRSDLVTEGRFSQQCTPVMKRREMVDSPAGSPMMSRKGDCDEQDLDNSVISGWLKFRDNKRWKSRWGVITKLSPAADCLHLQLYRDPKDRFKKGQTKASLSLQQFIAVESGFTLDKESNTIAIICRDVIVVIAFETRERLIAWQVKINSQLGSSKEFLVMIGSGGSTKMSPGPARLHLQGARFAMTAGVPPRLLGIWELTHLRRYGVVDGRFCFEGGSHCGKGEGLHVLITDQPHDISEAFDVAAQGKTNLQRTPGTSRKSFGNNRPDSRLSDLNADQSIPDTASALYEENFFGEDLRGISPLWPSDERRGFEDNNREDHTPWCNEKSNERCNNCCSRIGSQRSAPSAASNFNPAWTMESVSETKSDPNTEYLTPRALRKKMEAPCHCKDKPPERPPKPGIERKLLTKLPDGNKNSLGNHNPKVGPYENYDVPKITHCAEVHATEFYDSPKRIQTTADNIPNQPIGKFPKPKENCSCFLQFPKKPVIVECDESLQPVECPCQRVTNWANSLISLPYCKKNNFSENIKCEALDPNDPRAKEMALYATVDVSRKSNRSGSAFEKDTLLSLPQDDSILTNYENYNPCPGKLDHDVQQENYENLDFAKSLEHYENAKDLLKKAGATQKELVVLSSENINITLPKKNICAKCEHCQYKNSGTKGKGDEYLLMEPGIVNSPNNNKNPGYTPMVPNPVWTNSIKPTNKVQHEVDKSFSNPTLNGSQEVQNTDGLSPNTSAPDRTKRRSGSIDSSLLIDELKEFDSSIGSQNTSSSLETLRNLVVENKKTPNSSCQNCYTHCCKCSISDKNCDSTNESPHLRNKLLDDPQAKRPSSVPCKSGNRDSSSSNDSGVSSCSLKHCELHDYEMPITSGSNKHCLLYKRMRGSLTGCIHSSLPRKSRSSDPLRDMSMQLSKPAKSSSAEAEVPVLPPKQLKGVMDTFSTSSGTSDMSDYIETLSITSSHSSSDTNCIRAPRQSTSTLRPRSGKEYHNLDPIITSIYKTGPELDSYTNIP